MPHCARKHGESGFYHVVTKGDGGQLIFEDESDRRGYVGLLEKAVDEFPVSVHGYCLMSNHVHLLLEDAAHDGSFSAFMKKVCEMHARHFQRKTGRVGHVYKGRFWSEPVESDEYFLSALRYIHANPETAGICRTQEYPWSSYRSYCETGTFVRTDLAREMLGGVSAFERFSASGCKRANPFPGSSLRKHLSSDELLTVAVNVLGREGLNTIKQQPRGIQKEGVLKLTRAGFTANEIVRLTGLGRQTVRNIVNQPFGDCPQMVG